MTSALITSTSNCGARLAACAQDLISASNSRYNNTEHFNFIIPTTGEYMLRVRWIEELFDLAGDVNIEQYGLAWSTSVPEPAAALLAALGSALCCIARKQRTAIS